MLAGNSTVAQIAPDGTLPLNSIVTPSDNTFTIDGGTQAGGNLFHSFGEFSVPTGGVAFFNNGVDIQNIFSRVTGSSISNIDGLIRANGIANLFLINPNGVIFGRNARLNIGGSFVASTGSSLKFADGIEFSAANPSTSPLLTISVPIGLQYTSNVANIRVEGSTLTTPGKTIELLGGSVTIDNGQLLAGGGRVELGGISEAGTIGFNPDGSLNFPSGVQRGDVLLTNQARVDVRAGGGGSITINARNLEIVGSSRLSAGIGQLSGSAQTQAGNITLNATEAITITKSYLFNNVETFGIGQGGNITIESNSLSLIDGGQIGAITFARGNTGRISLQANDSIVLRGNGTAIFGTVEPQAIGNSGGISIKAGSLAMRDGAILITSTYGTGNAGNITIEVNDFVSLIGGDSVKNPTLPQVDVSNVVVGGSNVSAAKLIGSEPLTDEVSRGGSSPEPPPVTTNILPDNPIPAPIPAPAPAPAPAPPPVSAPSPPPLSPLTVIGSPTSIASTNSTIWPSTSIFSTVAPGGIGNAGDIAIEARSLSLSGGAGIQSGTRGQGNGGTLLVNVADAVDLSGVSPDGFSSGLFTSSDRPNSQQGGDLIVNTRELRLSDGAVLSARTRSAFRGGDITVNVTTLELTGGAQILATTFGAGSAGNITVNAAEKIAISGNDPTYAVRLAQFDRELVDPDGPKSGFSVSGRDTGGAGNLEIRASSIVLDDGGTLSAETAAGDRGNITLQTQNLQLRRNSSIAANAIGTATGGNITIDTDVLVALENSDITANAQEAFGGQVIINAQGIFGAQLRDQQNPATDFTSDITATSEAGLQLNGTVTIGVPNIDPSSGLVTLPENVVDVDVAIDRRCSSSYLSNSFTVIGTGGLPNTPYEQLSSRFNLTDIQFLQQDLRVRSRSEAFPTEIKTEIVEATGIARSPDGKVILTASVPTVRSPSVNHSSCQTSE